MNITEFVQSKLNQVSDVQDTRKHVRIQPTEHVDITGLEPYEPCMQRAIDEVKSAGYDPYACPRLVRKLSNKYHAASRVREFKYT